MRPAAFAAVVFAVALSACDDEPARSLSPTQTAPSAAANESPASPTSSPSPTSPASAAPAPTSSGSGAPTEKRNLEVLAMTLTSNVKDREPVDHLDAAQGGMRVYAYVKLRNRSGEKRRVSLLFRVNGEERSTVDLSVEPSWSFRTWGYNTLRATDRSGTLSVELRAEGGELLRELSIPVRGASSDKPKR